jgi:ActR/RegA family two-component response regulator
MNFIQKVSGAVSNVPSPTHEEKRAQASSHTRLSGSCVLVVEDDFIVALDVQSSLEEAGATIVGPAFTLSRALELATRENISAATLDLRLGHDSSASVAAVLDERHIPFLFYTGQPVGDPVRRAWPHTKVLSKPASGHAIVDAIAEIMRTTH